jgi:hypothetical protein
MVRDVVKYTLIIFILHRPFTYAFSNTELLAADGITI